MTEAEDKKGALGWSTAAKPNRSPRGQDAGMLSKRGKDAIHFEVNREAEEESAVNAFTEDFSIEDKILFYKERECLLLLLESRKLLASMIYKKEQLHERLRKEKRQREEDEKKRAGKLNVQEIQNLLQNSPDQDDYDMVSGKILIIFYIFEKFS